MDANKSKKVEDYERLRKCLTNLNAIGQGTFFYTNKEQVSFSILISTEEEPKGDKEDNPEHKDEEKKPKNYVALRVVSDRAIFSIKVEGFDEETLSETFNHPPSDSSKSPINVGAEPKVMRTYWFSFDNLKRKFKYGKGYTMEASTLMVADMHDYDPKDDEKRKLIAELLDLENDMFIWVYSTEKFDTMALSLIEMENTYGFRPTSFVSDYPPVVLDSSAVTVFDLDRARFMFSSDLPRACQDLYGNIKGLVFEELGDPSIKLTDALRHSLNTPGCILSNKLADKKASHEFEYLRVTLGPDQKTGPGIPYVLEIWPSGKGSPIHNHSGSCAIIKVLFGRITVKVYNKMGDPQPKLNPKADYLKMFDCKEGQVTWISPEWYQTHQLVNRTDDFCATIQCYRYEDDDKIRYAGFDYLGKQDQHRRYTDLEVFYPNSDFTYVALCTQVLGEYREYLSSPQKW